MRKYTDCKKFPLKCTSNSNFFHNYNYYILINLLDNYAYYLLLIQSDFIYEIKESIIKLDNENYYLVIYYSKYYCEFNYIKYF